MESGEFDFQNINDSLLNKLFDPAPFLQEFERKMNGEVKKNNEWVKVRRSLAGNEFISKAIMNLGAIINTHSLMANFTEESDFYYILVENVKAFLTASLNEVTIKPDNYMQIYLLYSNPIEMFAKLVIGGHSTETIKQIMTNTYNEMVKDNKKTKEGFDPFARTD